MSGKSKQIDDENATNAIICNVNVCTSRSTSVKHWKTRDWPFPRSKTSKKHNHVINILNEGKNYGVN